MRCRPGIVTNSACVTIPDLLCSADALRRVQEKLSTGDGTGSLVLAILALSAAG
jgi:hypothetical protein